MTYKYFYKKIPLSLFGGEERYQVYEEYHLECSDPDLSGTAKVPTLLFSNEKDASSYVMRMNRKLKLDRIKKN